MRRQEQRLWDTFKRHMPKTWKADRVENSVAEGMPDVHLMVEGRCVWLELKAPNRPLRDTSTLFKKSDGLRATQKNWFFEAAKRKIPAFVLIRDSLGVIYLIPADKADNLDGLSCNEMRAISLADSWKGVAAVIENRSENEN